MKKLIFIVICICLFCIPGLSNARGLSADGQVAAFYIFAPRFIAVTVTDAEDEPVVGEKVTLNASYREYFNFADGQPFNPIEQFPFKLTTNSKGQVWFWLMWGHYFVYVQDQVQEKACGVPFKVYELFFKVDN